MIKKEVVVTFDDLLNAKKRVDDLTKKYEAMVKNGAMFNNLSHILLKRDSALNSFYMVASIYYNNQGLTVERLQELFEEEKKYHSTPSQTNEIFIETKKENFDFDDECIYFDDDNEAEYDEDQLRGI